VATSAASTKPSGVSERPRVEGGEVPEQARHHAADADAND
jgi:hypothetical protein